MEAASAFRPSIPAARPEEVPVVPTPNPWGLPERTHRLLRGWGVASVAVFVGAGSHAVLTGHLPHPLILGLCWSLSGMLCVLLAGLRLPRLSTGLGVLGSQAGLHTLLTLAGHGAAPVGHSAGHASHHGDAGPLLLAASGASADAVHQLSTLMLAVHALAAVLTILAIRRGDAAVAGLLRAVRLGLRRLLTLPGPVPTPAPRPRPLILSCPAVLVSRIRPGTVATRGPPLALPA